MWSKRTQKNEQTQIGNPTNSQMSLFFCSTWRSFHRGVERQYRRSHLQKTTRVIVWLTKRIQENRTMTIFFSLELSLSLCMEMGNLTKKLRKCWHCSQRRMELLIQQLFKVFVWMMSDCRRLGSSEHLLVRQRICGWSNDWRADQKKCWQTFRNCPIITLH